MARRVCSEERVWIEVLSAEGLSDSEIAARLGRDRATVWRERRRCGGGDYCARRAQDGADARAARPRPSKLAADAVLGREVQQRLDERLSPHAVSAELAGMGMSVCAETIYRACYDHAALSGLAAGTWNKLPRARRRRRPRSRCEQAKRSPLGDYRPIAERPASVEGRKEPGHWEGDLIIGKANRSAVATLVERSSRCTLVVGLAGGYDAQSTARAVAAALVRQPAAMLKTLTWEHPRTRDGPLGRHRTSPGNRGVLLRAPIPLAAANQRADQRPATAMAAQINRPRHRSRAPRNHRGQPQHHAPQNTQLELSPNRLHCPQLQPPIELATHSRNQLSQMRERHSGTSLLCLAKEMSTRVLK